MIELPAIPPIEVSGRVIIARVTERERLLPSLEEVRGELVAPPDGVSAEVQAGVGSLPDGVRDE